MNTPLTHESTCDAESNFKRLLSTTKPPFFDRAANEQLTRQQCLASRLDLRRGTSSPSVSWLRVPLSARGCVSALFSGILREGFFRRNDSLTEASFPIVLPQKIGARVKNIRDLVRDVVGSAPYEKRLMELLKVGRDKRALKLAKRKVRRRKPYGIGF